MNNAQILQQMVLLFATIAIGYILTRTRVFSGEARRHLSAVVLSIATPCTMLYSVLGTQPMLDKREALLLSVVVLIFYLALVALARAVPHLLRVPERERGIYRFMTVFSNCGFMGFPVVRAVFGEGALFHCTIFNIFFSFFCYTYGVLQLAVRPEDRRVSLRLLAQPPLIAALISYGCYFLDLQPVLSASAPGRMLVEILGFLEQMNGPLSMLVIGISLAQVPLRGVFGNGRLYGLIALRQIVLPIVMALVLRPFVRDPLFLGICVIMAAMPIGAIISMLCAKYDVPDQTAVAGVFLSTLFSVPGIPMIMALLF